MGAVHTRRAFLTQAARAGARVARRFAGRAAWARPALAAGHAVPPSRPSPDALAPLAQRFSDLRRHFIFDFYPWYGGPPDYLHWDYLDRHPPLDLSSNYVPRLGPYDTRARAVLEQQATLDRRLRRGRDRAELVGRRPLHGHARARHHGRDGRARHQGDVLPGALPRRSRQGLREGRALPGARVRREARLRRAAPPAQRGRQGGPALQGLRLHPARGLHGLPRPDPSRRRLHDGRAVAVADGRGPRGAARPVRPRDPPGRLAALAAHGRQRLRRHHRLRQLHRARPLRGLRGRRFRRRPRVLVQHQPRLRHDRGPRRRARVLLLAARTSPRPRRRPSTGRAATSASARPG